MTIPSCPRTWMAEAIEDGRLGELERVSFERHAAICNDCTRAATELAHLRDVVRQLPVPGISDIERHHQRAQLIERAYRRIVSAEGRIRFQRLMAAGTLVAVLAGIVWLGWPRPTVFQPGLAEKGNDEAALGPPIYEVTALQKGDWTREETGNVARVRLVHGSAEFHVHPLRAGQRFLVDLPDGEIEVRGTRFVVAVNATETRYVVVTEGKVVLRRQGDGERLLLAGERWDHLRASPQASDRLPKSGVTANREAKAMGSQHGYHTVGALSVPRATAHPAQTVALVPNGERRPLPSPPKLRGDPRSGASVAVFPDSTPPTPTSLDAKAKQAALADRPPISADLFARGIAAFRGGRYADADRLLQTFQSERPSDPRTEDAAFLRAVSRSRMGDVRGAAVLARDYLRQFPRGLRRPEAESLSIRAP